MIRKLFKSYFARILWHIILYELYLKIVFNLQVQFQNNNSLNLFLEMLRWNLIYFMNLQLLWIPSFIKCINPFWIPKKLLYHSHRIYSRQTHKIWQCANLKLSIPTKKWIIAHFIVHLLSYINKTNTLFSYYYLLLVCLGFHSHSQASATTFNSWKTTLQLNIPDGHKLIQ